MYHNYLKDYLIDFFSVLIEVILYNLIELLTFLMLSNKYRSLVLLLSCNSDFYEMFTFKSHL